MNLLMLAPPGAGKGTQSERLAARFSIVHIASGELLRAEVNAGSELGREAASYLAQGDLVPDRLVIAMIMDRCIAAAATGGFVLDGFPRNLAQAQAASEAAAATDAELDAVVSLEVSAGELRRRLMGRAATEDRSDDRRVIVEHRLEVYQEQTQPLLEFYASQGILHCVDGEQTVDQVFAAILATLSALSLPDGPPPPG